MLCLRFCARAFSSCGERGPLFIAVRGPLTVAASLVAEHRLQTHRLSSCGSRAQLLHGMWDLPRLGLEPVSPALAGRFSTTAPPGKPLSLFLMRLFLTKPVMSLSSSTLIPKVPCAAFSFEKKLSSPSLKKYVKAEEGQLQFRRWVKCFCSLLNYKLNSISLLFCGL